MPVLSPISTVDIPQIDLVSFFFQKADKRENHAALTRGNEKPRRLIVDGLTNESYTYQDIKDMSERLASALISEGYLHEQHAEGNGSGVDNASTAPENTVLVFSPNDIRFSPIHFATLMAGGTYAAVSSGLSVDDLSHILASVEPVAAFVSSELLSTFVAACSMSGLACLPKNTIIIRGSVPGYTSFDKLICKSPTQHVNIPQLPAANQVKQKAALIVYSSGTTGKPKGVILTHYNIVSMFVMVGGYSARSQASDTDTDTDIEAEAAATQSRILSTLPVNFLYGHCVLCYQPLATGDCTIQLPKFSLEMYLRTIERYEIERLSAAPAILHEIFTKTSPANNGKVSLNLDPSRTFNICTVKAIGCGGTTLAPYLKAKYSHYFGGVPIIQGYGMTETSSIIAGSSWEVPKDGAVGIIYPNSKAKVLDESGNETYELGELCVCGPHVMKGYVNSEVPFPTTSDGFLRTGDYARIDQHGNVFVKGRICDIIHTKGGLIPPSDIEHSLIEHPAVRDCAVVGIKDQSSEMEVPLAYIDIEDNVARTDIAQVQSIESWISSRLGFHVSCSVISEVPKNHSGKILRHLLRQSQ